MNVIGDDLGAEAFGVLAHAVHQFRALQTLDVTGPVVHVGGGHQLAALLGAGDQQRLPIGARRVDRGAVAGRAGAEDDQTTVHGRAHVQFPDDLQRP